MKQYDGEPDYDSDRHSPAIRTLFNTLKHEEYLLETLESDYQKKLLATQLALAKKDDKQNVVNDLQISISHLRKEWLAENMRERQAEKEKQT